MIITQVGPVISQKGNNENMGKYEQKVLKDKE
jgi:hypothetical protein